MRLINFLCRLVMAADNTESKIVRLIEEDPQGWRYIAEVAMMHEKTDLYIHAYLGYRYLIVRVNDVECTLSRGERRLIFSAARKAIDAHTVIQARAAKKRMEMALTEALAKAGL